MALRAVIQQDLSGGTNVISSPYVIGKKQSVLLTNLLLDEHGSVRTRDGTKILTTSPVSGQIVRVFKFNRQDGLVFELVIVRATDRDNQLWVVNRTTMTVTGVTAAAAPEASFTVAGNQVGRVPVGLLFRVVGSTGNDGVYTATAVGYNGSGTVIEVAETVASAVADGYVVVGEAAGGLPPQQQDTGAESTWIMLHYSLLALQYDWAFQFTANANYDVQKVAFDLVRVGSAAGGTVWVEIQTDAGGLPSNTIIPNGTSNTVAHPDLPTEMWHATDFTFATAPSLSDGTTYHLVLKATGWTPSPSEHVRIHEIAPGVNTAAKNSAAAPTTWAESAGRSNWAIFAVVSGAVPGGGWQLLGTFGTDYAIPDILTFTNKALIANGYEKPWAFNGDTLVHVEDTPATGHVPPGACHHALHQGYYWVWNTAPVSTAGTSGGSPSAPTNPWEGPSALQSSDLNNPNSWPLANQIFIDKDDGSGGMGLAQFTVAESGIAPSTSQILFKAYSAYQMSGVFGSTNPLFSIQKIKSDMGCLGPRTIRFAPGFGIIRLTHRGFSMFDGVDDRLISLEVNPLIFGSAAVHPIDWTRVFMASAVVTPNPPCYVCAVPVCGEVGLTRVFSYDLVRRAWTVFRYPLPLACIQLLQDAVNVTP